VALINIPAGSSYLLNRVNLATMIGELVAREGSTLTDFGDQDGFWRSHNRDAIEEALHIILTDNGMTEHIEYFQKGSSFRQCRPQIRRMLVAAYSVDN